MKFDELDARMRTGEYFHNLRVPPWAWTVIRVDGRSFSRFTEKMKKPFDEEFHDAMCGVAKTLFEDFQGVYAYTESDEISLLLPKDTDLFDREVEKLVSVSAALAASTITAYYKGEYPPCAFDSRIWVGMTDQDVTDYFRWRAADAHRCALNSYAYWTLRLRDGMSEHEASRTLERKGIEYKEEILQKHGLKFENAPAWQRLGTGFYWEAYSKEGWNPIKQEKVMAERRRVKIDKDLPVGDEYSSFILRLLPKTEEVK